MQVVRAEKLPLSSSVHDWLELQGEVEHEGLQTNLVITNACAISRRKITRDFRQFHFHHHAPLHALKVTDISVKLNRMQCKQSDFIS